MAKVPPRPPSVKPQPQDELQAIRLERSTFREHFTRGAGPEILAWIGNECGAWSQDPQKVKPELIAMWNRLLGKIGTVHEANLRTIASSLLEASNDEDLIALQRRAQTQRKEDQ